jgi:hypothetical protein
LFLRSCNLVDLFKLSILGGVVSSTYVMFETTPGYHVVSDPFLTIETRMFPT